MTTTGEEGCTRGDAAAVLDAAKVTGHSFTRGVGPRAEEKATIPGGIALTVVHTGCAHFVERYTFRLPHDGTPGPDYPWLTKTAELVKSLPVRADRIETTAQWASRLTKRSAEKPAYVLGDEIAVEEKSSLSLHVTSRGGESEIELVYDRAH